MNDLLTTAEEQIRLEVLKLAVSNANAHIQNGNSLSVNNLFQQFMKLIRPINEGRTEPESKT